ncbi:hypothetical protein VTO73DRAFT_4519 [Trametes versicolor]
MYSEDTFLDPELEKLFGYAGEARILAFRKEVCEETDLYQISPDFYNVDNKYSWVDKTAFKIWLARRLQAERVAQQPGPQTPSSRHSSTQAQTPERQSHTPSATKRKRCDSSGPPTAAPASGAPAATKSADPKRPSKKTKAVSHAAGVAFPSTSGADGRSWEYITRQTRVQHLIHLTEVPRTWAVPEPGEDFAYLLDLSEDTDNKWTKNREFMLMAAIIKAEDQDAWGGGSSGSKKKAVKVLALKDEDDAGGVLCQHADHVCQGIYYCEYLDPTILANCERFRPDQSEVRQLAEAECEQNVAQTSSEEADAAVFYNTAQTSKCHFVDDEGTLCTGSAVLRKMKPQSTDGKYHFVGCSSWSRNDPDGGRRHRCIMIPLNVTEQLVLELFQTRGKFKTFLDGADCAISGYKCTYMAPPRSGAKGDHKCHHSHIIDGAVARGSLVKKACTTRMQIWYPIDRADRQAIVKIEASSTKMFFNGLEPYEFDPALANTRQRNRIIQDLKKEKMPEGTGFGGVLKRYIDEETKPADERYMQVFDVKDGVPVNVTLLPELAKRIHTAKATLHDNTYKRVAGKDWKEWEVVIWLEDIDMRLTVGRIYCTRERREDFERIWTLFFGAVNRATGQEVMFKAFAPNVTQAGLRAILVDGCQAQIDGLGDFLVKRNVPSTSGVLESDPQKIVEWVVKICGVHFDRNLTELSHKCSADIMTRVQQLPNLKTQAELDDFKQFCEESTNKALRDWWTNKKGMPWFIAGINRNFSKMLPGDWQSTPNNTNINKSAHTLTNTHTRTGLSLLEAIISAENFDIHQAGRIRVTQETGIHANLNNTPSKRMKRNAARAAARRAKAAESKKKSPSSDDEGTSTAQTRRNSHAGKGKHDGTFAIDDTWVPDLSEATPTGAYHDLPPSISDPGSSAGPSRLWTAQMSYQHLMGQPTVSAPSQPYCTSQTLGDVPCPETPIVSPIWALVPLSPTLHRLSPLWRLISQNGNFDYVRLRS